MYSILKELDRPYIFRARLEQDEDGRWSSWIDVLPGCAAWGYTADEALSALRDAVEVYIEDMVEAGEEIPKENAARSRLPAVTITL